MDVIVVISDQWNDYINEIYEVLRSDFWSKFNHKPPKCAFAQEYVKFSGHIMGKVKISPSEVIV